LADKFGCGSLCSEIDIDSKVVDGDTRFDKRVSGRDLHIAAAEGKEIPEVNANGIRIPSVVEEFDDRCCIGE